MAILREDLLSIACLIDQRTCLFFDKGYWKYLFNLSFHFTILVIHNFRVGQLETLGTQKDYPIEVPIRVLQENKSIRITDNVVKVINN